MMARTHHCTAENMSPLGQASLQVSRPAASDMTSVMSAEQCESQALIQAKILTYGRDLSFAHYLSNFKIICGVYKAFGEDSSDSFDLDESECPQAHVPQTLICLPGVYSNG